MSLVNEEVIYRCSCHAEIKWRISFDWTAPQPTGPGTGVYRGLAASLRLVGTNAKRKTGTFRIRLVTMAQKQVVLMRKAPSRMVTIGDGKKTTYGRLNLDTGEYTVVRELEGLNALLDEANLSLKTAVTRHGLMTNKCSNCGHALKDPRSKRAGYGPVCAKHLGLPWGGDEIREAPQPEAMGARGLNEDVIYKCACGAEIEWRMTPSARVNITAVPANAAYGDLTVSLSRLIAVSGVDHFNIRLVTMKKAEVVLSWNARSRSVTVSDGGTTNYGSLNLDDGVYRELVALEGMNELLTEANVSLVAAARRHGQETAVCSFCGLHLYDPHSLDAGYGPVCAAHYGLPWGEAVALPQLPVEEHVG